MIRLLTIEETHWCIKDDTVRPHLGAQFRNEENRFTWGLFEDKYATEHKPSPLPLAVLCTAYTNAVPRNENELAIYSRIQTSRKPTIAVFYTVWSYEKGAGQRIVNDVSDHIYRTQPDIKRWVTMSPLTKMAERFHLKNGARFVNSYEDNQTFEYTHLFDVA